MLGFAPNSSNNMNVSSLLNKVDKNPRGESESAIVVQEAITVSRATESADADGPETEPDVEKTTIFSSARRIVPQRPNKFSSPAAALQAPSSRSDSENPESRQATASPLPSISRLSASSSPMKIKDMLQTREPRKPREQFSEPRAEVAPMAPDSFPEETPEEEELVEKTPDVDVDVPRRGKRALVEKSVSKESTAEPVKLNGNAPSASASADEDMVTATPQEPEPSQEKVNNKEDKPERKERKPRGAASSAAAAAAPATSLDGAGDSRPSEGETDTQVKSEYDFDEDAQEEQAPTLAKGEFVIDAILDFKVEAESAIWLYIKWEGTDNSWEPEHLIQQDAPNMLYEFWAAKGGREQATGLDVYHVFKVLKYHPPKGYSVQWVGFPPVAPHITWEPKDSIQSIAPDAVKEYEKTKGSIKAPVSAPKTAGTKRAAPSKAAPAPAPKRGRGRPPKK